MNLTVFVGTCDAYSSLWDNFTQCFKKYWPYNTDVLFVGETLKHSEYNTCDPGLGLPWGQRMLTGLEQVKTDYIFFLLEDYFLSYQYPEEQIETYIKDMDKYKMAKLQISRSSGQLYIGTNDTYLAFHPQSGYLFSMQPSLWHKDWVKFNMDPNFTPHDFEVKNSNRYLGKSTNTYLDGSINFPVYFNAVRKGFIKSPGWEEFRQQQKLKEI